jgi:thioesterase-3
MTNTIDIKVRGYHLDLFGHVNNARYLEFLEEGRWSFFEAHLDLNELLKHGLAFVVVNININFRRPAFLHDTIQVATRLDRTGKRSGIIEQGISAKETGQPISDATVTFALVDTQSGRAAEFDERIQKLLQPLQEG